MEDGSRVAIARSIAKKPTLLLGDELTGNLDTETSKKVMEVLVEAYAKNITAIFVTRRIAHTIRNESNSYRQWTHHF